MLPAAAHAGSPLPPLLAKTSGTSSAQQWARIAPVPAPTPPALQIFRLPASPPAPRRFPAPAPVDRSQAHAPGAPAASSAFALARHAPRPRSAPHAAATLSYGCLQDSAQHRHKPPPFHPSLRQFFLSLPRQPINPPSRAAPFS